MKMATGNNTALDCHTCTVVRKVQYFFQNAYNCSSVYKQVCIAVYGIGMLTNTLKLQFKLELVTRMKLMRTLMKNVTQALLCLTWKHHTMISLDER